MGDGRALQYASMDSRADRDLVMLAVGSNGLALQFAHMDLRADRELVMRAVRCHGLALEFAHVSLQVDDEIAELAVRQCRGASRFVASKRVLASVLAPPD